MKFIPKKMISEYGQEVYEKVSDLTGLKFKTQIKGSGIVFMQIHELSNLVSEERFYVLTTNSVSIKFINKDEFIQKFIKLIKQSIDKLNADYQELLSLQNQAIVDENMIFIENERIGYSGNKQIKLLNKMREFRTVLPSINE